MKIYTFLAEAQKFMYENYFLSSLPKDLEPHATIHTEPYVDYGVTPFGERTRSKLHFMAEACKENFGEIIVFSDADVQFFGPIKKILIEELDDFDIACQQGGIFTYFSLCPGFFVCKCNDMTLKLFDNMKKFFRTDDQFSLNEQKWICKYKSLSPSKFFTIGHVLYLNNKAGKRWEEGGGFPIPDTILMHHASGVVGLEKKLKLLDIVRTRVNNKQWF
ncbi:MAG TPA: hypothetical protein EYN67_08860 [Flavobacteriales bacterium]|nr:hypothetical protein [Flavobacteriales bacterium]HIB44600.1 hypothetical protein [Nitrospina sp.]